MISLEEMCLNLIVKEFKRFHFAFTKTNDEDLKKYSEILQRRYSFKIVSKLFKKEELKDEYLEFFINKHLKLLDGAWLESCRYLTLEDILCRLPKLKSICLSKHCCNEILANIAKFCPKIVEIDITCSSVTDSGVKYLCKDENGITPCPRLKNLFINRSKVTDEGVEYLIRNLPSLEKIDYKNVPQILYSMNKRHLSNFQGVQSCSLVELNLLNCSMNNSDLLKTCLTACYKLKSMTCRITDENQLCLFNNFSFEKLHLEFLKRNPKMNASKLLKSNGCNVVSLTLCNCIISIFDLAGSFPKLKYLLVKSINFMNYNNSDDNNSRLILPCLQKCVFHNVVEDSQTDEAIKFILTSSPKLESISFKDFNLSLDIQTSILKCCENHLIKEITFQDFIVEINFIEDVLTSCPSLETLNLTHCCLDDDEERRLHHFVTVLPNKPRIRCDNFDFSDSDSYDDSSDSLRDSEESTEHDDEE